MLGGGAAQEFHESLVLAVLPEAYILPCPWPRPTLIELFLRSLSFITVSEEAPIHTFLLGIVVKVPSLSKIRDSLFLSSSYFPNVPAP